MTTEQLAAPAAERTLLALILGIVPPHSIDGARPGIVAKTAPIEDNRPAAERIAARRKEIIDMLRDTGPATSVEVAEWLEVAQSVANRDLYALRDEGLIKSTPTTSGGHRALQWEVVEQ